MNLSFAGAGPVRPPQQARSVASMNRILDVASALLAEGGWDAFTIAEISRRADVSVGVIYQRFGDKGGLFAAVHDAHLAQFEARARRAFDYDAWPTDMESRALVHGVVEQLGMIFEDLGALNGVMIINSNKVPGLSEKGADVMADLRRQVTDLIRSRSCDMPRDHADVAVEICFRLAFSTFMDFSTFSRYQGQWQEMSWHRLISEVADACTTYLFSPQPAP